MSARLWPAYLIMLTNALQLCPKKACKKQSREDIQLTKKMREMSDMVGIYFCDHIIIGREGYYSFSEEK